MRVLKFGGKSLFGVENFDVIAKKLSTQNMDNSVIVVSAMGNTTTELFKMTEALGSPQSKREQDMLLTSGERISAALMSMALQKYGVKAQSFTGSQAGILTNGPHTDANIKEVKPFRVEECLKKKIVPVIAGFQGVDPDVKDITTLGRGGSDLTAVALAHHFKASVEFYKSVGGVFTCDPNICDSAKPLNTVSHEFLCKISNWGGKVIHEKAASLASENNLNLKFINDKNFKLITQTSQTCNSFAICTLDSIITLNVKGMEISKAVEYINNTLSTEGTPNWKIIASAHDSGDSRFMIKTDDEKKSILLNQLNKDTNTEILQDDLCGVSCIFSKEPTAKNIQGLFSSVNEISTKRLLETSHRYTFFIKLEDKKSFIDKAHEFLINNLEV